jgi:hypothetical protein
MPFPLTRYRAVALLSALLLAGVAAGAAREDEIEARMRRDITLLASDEYEGRGVGTAGLNKAADYIARQFAEAGLKPAGPGGSYFQPFPFSLGAEQDGTSTLTLRGPKGQEIPLKQGTDFQVIGFSGAGKVSAPLVFVGYGATAKDIGYDDYKGVDVKGKVVVMIRRTPRWSSKELSFDGKRKEEHAGLETKLALAGANKAAAILLINDTSELPNDGLMSFKTTARGASTGSLPFLHVKRSIIEPILRSSLGQGLPDIEQRIDRDLATQSAPLPGWTATLDAKVKRKTVEVKNVAGVLEGSGPLAHETIVIGAHYDHLGFGGPGSRQKGEAKKAIHHGADDNASGTTTLLELARQFGARKDRVGRRLVFLAFTAEESGLIGSRYYTKSAALFPLKDTAAMVNLDMVGRLRPDAKTGKDKLLIEGAGTAKSFDKMLDKLNPGFALVKKAGGNGPSDHDSFYNQKIPVVFFWTGMHDDYHLPSDTVDKINVAGMRRVVEYAVKVIDVLATEAQRPEYVAIASSFSPGGGGCGSPSCLRQRQEWPADRRRLERRAGRQGGAQGRRPDRRDRGPAGDEREYVHGRHGLATCGASARSERNARRKEAAAQGGAAVGILALAG